MTTAGSRWGVVMSRNLGYYEQVVELDFLYPSDGIHRRWESGYRITSMAATADQAALILSIPKRKVTDETQETLRTSAFPSTHVKEKWAKNLFNGSIPPELFSLKNLQCLDLSRNDIGGTLSGNIKALKNLQELILSENFIEGDIPPEISSLAQLRTLTLRQNLFSGSIPLSVSQLTKLETFDLQNNYLSFEIPDGIGKLANISTLSLSMNKLSGGIPSSIQNLTNLDTLELENNNGLYGEIPTWLFGLQKLKILRLRGNKFQWNKNVSVYAQSKLTHLSLRSCGLEGNIPDWLKNQTALLPGSEHEQTRRKFSQMSIRLSVLALSRNKFSGQIPDTVGETWVMILMLSENNFSGSVPKSISKIHRLLLLDLSKNKLSGECPCFDPESLLALLDISSNEFSGDVPAFFGSNTIMLSMSQNNFSGEFPHDFTNLPSLMHLDLHDNKISGNVPSFISWLSSSLEVLSLRNNSLEGSIPEGIAILKSQGEIPQTLSKLRELNVLELRNNKLTGRSRIPESPQLDRLNDPNIYANNNKLCGMQIQEPSSTQTKQPEEDKEETMFSWKAAVIGCPCGFLMAVVVMYMVGYFSDSSVITTTKAISQEQRTEEIKNSVFLKRNGRSFRCCNNEKSTKDKTVCEQSLLRPQWSK
ncbi:unnamed protein product [Arabidopsis arenosa]|uniref:Leucine-rich repeat family protein n=1 Tax=Arabidopsis arenosa TaxID=38785 RepID=A0A8S1ZUC8_ARAAE|nr:unnamed protein product [Arabidopsis arenosa]